MALWDEVVAAYERPGIPEACLTLQDEHGQNTSLLLWAAIVRPHDEAVLAQAAAARASSAGSFASANTAQSSSEVFWPCSSCSARQACGTPGRP
jgi:uncharacterized protein (TIGR02444 family)